MFLDASQRPRVEGKTFLTDNLGLNTQIGFTALLYSSAEDIGETERKAASFKSVCMSAPVGALRLQLRARDT